MFFVQKNNNYGTIVLPITAGLLNRFAKALL